MCDLCVPGVTALALIDFSYKFRKERETIFLPGAHSKYSSLEMTLFLHSTSLQKLKKKQLVLIQLLQLAQNKHLKQNKKLNIVFAVLEESDKGCCFIQKLFT